MFLLYCEKYLWIRKYAFYINKEKVNKLPELHKEKFKSYKENKEIHLQCYVCHKCQWYVINATINLMPIWWLNFVEETSSSVFNRFKSGANNISIKRIKLTYLDKHYLNTSFEKKNLPEKSNILFIDEIICLWKNFLVYILQLYSSTMFKIS